MHTFTWNENCTIYMWHLAPFVVVIEGLDDNNRTVCVTLGVPHPIVSTLRNSTVRNVFSLHVDWYCNCWVRVTWMKLDSFLRDIFTYFECQFYRDGLTYLPPNRNTNMDEWIMFHFLCHVSSVTCRSGTLNFQRCVASGVIADVTSNATTMCHAQGIVLINCIVSVSVKIFYFSPMFVSQKQHFTPE